MPSSLRFTTLLPRALAYLAGVLLLAVELGAQGQASLPRLLGAELGPSPW